MIRKQVTIYINISFPCHFQASSLIQLYNTIYIYLSSLSHCHFPPNFVRPISSAQAVPPSWPCCRWWWPWHHPWTPAAGAPCGKRRGRGRAGPRRWLRREGTSRGPLEMGDFLDNGGIFWDVFGMMLLKLGPFCLDFPSSCFRIFDFFCSFQHLDSVLLSFCCASAVFVQEGGGIFCITLPSGKLT